MLGEGPFLAPRERSRPKKQKKKPFLGPCFQTQDRQQWSVKFVSWLQSSFKVEKEKEMAAASVAAATAVPVASNGPVGAEANGPAPVVPTIHRSSLYVGDVDKDVTEEELYALFQTVSPP